MPVTIGFIVFELIIFRMLDLDDESGQTTETNDTDLNSVMLERTEGASPPQACQVTDHAFLWLFFGSS